MPVVAVPSPLTSLTRQQLRRKVSLWTREPFRLAISEGYITPVNVGFDADTIEIAQSLTGIWNADDWWNNSTLLLTDTESDPPTTQMRRIVDYNKAARTITVAPDLDTYNPALAEIEIHSRTTPMEKHDAINDAITGGWHHFYKREGWTLAIPEGVGRLTQDHHLPTDWYRLDQVWLEPTLEMTGPLQASAVTTTTVTVAGAPFTADQYAGWQIAFVRGNAIGHLATITSNTTSVLTFPTVAALTGTSLPRFYLKKTEGYSPATATHESSAAWQSINDVFPIQHNAFAELYLSDFLQRCAGRSLLLWGTKRPVPLEDDADTTDLPEVYLKAAIGAQLNVHLGVAPGADHEGGRFVGRWDAEEALRLKRQLAWQLPVATRWTRPTKTTDTRAYSADGNPMDW